MASRITRGTSFGKLGKHSCKNGHHDNANLSRYLDLKRISFIIFNISTKALNREVELYGFFPVKALRKYHHALGRGLLPITPALFT